MLDLSDGLGGDAMHLAAASGVCIELELERDSRRSRGGRGGPSTGRTAEQLAAEGGEDYELLVALPPEFETADVAAFEVATRLAAHADRARRRGRGRARDTPRATGSSARLRPLPLILSRR